MHPVVLSEPEMTLTWTQQGLGQEDGAWGRKGGEQGGWGKEGTSKGVRKGGGEWRPLSGCGSHQAWPPAVRRPVCHVCAGPGAGWGLSGPLAWPPLWAAVYTHTTEDEACLLQNSLGANTEVTPAPHSCITAMVCVV